MRIFLTFTLVTVIALALLPGPAPRLSPDPLDLAVEQMRTSLTPKERVGQLMLVTFEGTYLDPETSIYRLITEYNIGGVMLTAENDNINGQVNTPRLVQSLTTELQQLAYDAANATQDRTIPRSFVPLFIATTHAGDDTQIAVGTTPLPSNMALGATWEPEFAQQVGHIAGSELSAMGVNMLFGPALDVLQRPQTERSLDLGVNSFGGEPYWVGKMAQAYVTGVHEGSQGHTAVIVQHFPGLGFADTQPDQEIPVVPRSVEELRQFDLIPFNAVTGGAGSTPARADGIQCANIRYQGENIRSITRPVCVDDQAAQQLLDLSYFTGWRDRGIMVSSPLGTRAIRRYYNATPFPHRQVAREAFLAGNDILYLTDFGPEPGDDQFENVTDVINFFAERYEDDPVFRSRVDDSLSRILRLKLSLYNGDISINNVLTAPTDIDQVGTSTAQLYAIAQQSATLIAPRRESLLPPPDRDDTIVIFTDVRLVQQCSYCPTYPIASVNALEIAIERMYGPYAGAQIRPEQVISFSFAQLQTYLRGNLSNLSVENSQFKTNQRLGEALRDVDWIVFVMLDVSPDVEASTVVRDLLETESSLVERAKIVVLALGAPVYLSSTEISKFAAYYSLYSSIPPYIDAAARALFQEAGFSGAPPISIPAVGYDIFERTAPDPAQTIRLEVESLAGKRLTRTSDTLTMNTGDRLVLRTAPLTDRNGHRVPDETPVEFTLAFLTDNLQTRQYGTTDNGIATTTFTPTRPGRIQITAASVDASRSSTFQLTVMEPGEASESTAFEATEDMAALPNTPPAFSTSSTIEAPAAGSSSDQPAAGDDHALSLLDLIISLAGLTIMGGLGFSVGLSSTLSRGGGIRVLLGSIIAGLAGYIYLGIGGPGASEILARLDHLAPITISVCCGLIGLTITWWTLPPD